MSDYAADLVAMFAQHWPIWCVTITLIVAAVIDGYELKVPNWITFPMIAAGWVYSQLSPACLGMKGWLGASLAPALAWLC